MNMACVRVLLCCAIERTQLQAAENFMSASQEVRALLPLQQHA